MSSRCSTTPSTTAGCSPAMTTWRRSSGTTRRTPRGRTCASSPDVIGPTMVQMDGADHDVRRAIVAPALVGRQLEQHYLPLVDRVVGDLFEAGCRRTARWTSSGG